ncbi:aminotransferase class IV [Mobilicoccus massiliensis]|uniref:aminotransferase class IV n=1 Tax=Mobilicoccus massiliensis TaxID=1522310 RepID=UPI0009E3B05B|nr:aminotransferase class IV [Mobilicoccus massiliensis]
MPNSPLQQVAAVFGRGIVPVDAPVVGVDDLGLTRGLGCFDATRVRFSGGEPRIDLLDEHLARLARSASALGIGCPASTAWKRLVDHLCEAYAGEAEAMLKLVLTGGGETDAAPPVAYATLTQLGVDTFRAREGISIATLNRGTASDAYADAPWLLGGVKTIAYAINLAAKEEAHRRGADDALFVSTDGYVLEGPTSAAVIRRRDRLLTTPTGPTGVLASITVDRICREAPNAGVTVDHELFTPADLAAADGAWFVSSVRGVAPLRRIDGIDLAVDSDGDALVRRLAGF